MDENLPTNGPEDQKLQMGSHYFVAGPPGPQPSRPLSFWIRKLLACNPFYLISAALLLYGLYLVSADDNFPGREAAQFGFNFGSLEFYEVLLVATAIFLARRRIWYDSVLLTGLENLLVLAPFILISQAALLNQRTVWLVCAAVGVAALFRFWSLKCFFKELNLPRRLLGCGFVLLLVNVALPLIYRHLHESKVGTKPTDGAAFEMNRYGWLFLLPALFALINLLPRPKKSDNLLPGKAWMPTGLFFLWVGGSTVHLYCLSYVYNFDWQFLFAVPSLWVALWSIQGRHSVFMSRPIPALSNILQIPPAAVAFLALTHEGIPIFLVLTTLNIALYATLLFKNRDNRTAFHLLLLSIAALPAGLLMRFETHAPAGFSVERWLILLVTAFLLYWVMRSRDAKAGLFGAAVVVVATLLFVNNVDLAVHPAVEFAMAFLLMHSLRWNDDERQTKNALRVATAFVWVFHAVFMVHSGVDHALPIVYGTSGVLLAG